MHAKMKINSVPAELMASVMHHFTTSVLLCASRNTTRLFAMASISPCITCDRADTMSVGDSKNNYFRERDGK